MNGCLRDRALLLLYYGGGISSQRTHLTKCAVCAARYRQLERDLEAISQVLREKSPQTVSHRSRTAFARWLPTSAALALALVLVWISVRIWNPSARSPVGGTDNGETWSFVEEFPSTLFLLNEAIAGDLRTWGAGSYDLAAAVLEADRPCEWYDLPAMATAESSPGDLEISGSLPFATCVEVEVKSGTTRMKPKT